MRKYQHILFAVGLLFVAVPNFASAVSGQELIPAWVNPVPNSVYNFGNSVVVTGTWQLPPNWVGNIYVYQDAPLDANGNMLGRGTLMKNTNGETRYAVNNIGGTATTSGTLTFDLGPQPDGIHNIHLEFWGGEECAVNKALNSLQSNLNYQPTCQITQENAAFNIVWNVRDYSIGLPPFPRMVVSPESDPALNFQNVVLGTPQSLSFSVSNTGGQTLSGTVPALSAPFRCVPNCSYVINPGNSRTITIEFLPTSAPNSFGQLVTFPCVGTTLACKKTTIASGGQVTETNQPSEVRRVAGNSVSNTIPPQISVSPSSLNYGTINLGSAVADQLLRVTNSGGGFLNGTVTFSSSEYTCVGSCNYSISAGGVRDVWVRFSPVTPGSRDDTAVFSGGGNQTVRIQSMVNDKPIMQVSNPFVNFGTSINVGTCREANVWIQNIGAGILKGAVSNIPVAPYTPTNAPSGFSCVGNCSYDNLTNGIWFPIQMRFCPTNNSPASLLVPLSNINNPGAGGQVTLSGQGNTSPIGSTNNWIIDWSKRLVGGSYPGSVTLSNTGVGVLSGSVRSIPPGFRCANNCTYAIPAGGSVQILFYFEPTAVRLYRGWVTLQGGPSVLLEGYGVSPDFKMSWQGWPGLWDSKCPGPSCLPPSPKMYDVGTTNFGGSAAIQNKRFYLYIQNLGDGASVNYSFPNTAHFKCLGGTYAIGGCSGTLTGREASNFYEAIRYEFQPSAPGNYDETVIVSYNYGDSVNRQLTLNLRGSSVSAPYLQVTPQANIGLGSVRIGNTATATFMVRNIGTGSLDGSVSILASPGSSPGAFRCVSGCTWSGLGKNAAQNTDIEFTPTNPNSYSAYPVFSSNGGTIGYPTSPHPSITGVGSASPTISISPLSLVFPNTNLGNFSNLIVTVTNTGMGTLTGNISPFAPSGLNFFCIGDCGYNLLPGQSVDKTIQFRPLATGDLSQTISFNSNAVNGTQSLSVFGKAVFAPIIDIRGSDTNYGNVVVGKFKDRTFIIRNSGTADLGVGTFEVIGSYACIDPVDINDGKCHYNLPAGSQVEVTIRFTPTAIGTADGVVSLSGVPLARFFVTGVGVTQRVKFEER